MSKIQTIKLAGGKGIEVTVDWHDKTTCKKCGGEIWFAKTKSGKFIPIEWTGLAIWDTHFISCPFAKEFRKKKD